MNASLLDGSNGKRELQASALKTTNDRQEKPMELWIVLIILTVLVTAGVWGSIILSGLFKRRALKHQTPTDDPRIGELREDHHQLEARLERLEEEVSFFRELQQPENPTQLPSPEKGGPDPTT